MYLVPLLAAVSLEPPYRNAVCLAEHGCNDQRGTCQTKRTGLPCPFAYSTPSDGEKARVSNSLKKLSCTVAASSGDGQAKTMTTVTMGTLAEELIQSSDGEGGSSWFALARWIQHPGELGIAQPRHICEIGLNTGLSAVSWLCAHPNAHYTSFDLLRSNISRRAVDFIRRAFPGRFDVVVGDTRQTMPRALDMAASSAARDHAWPGGAAIKWLRHGCDVLSIDGGHKFNEAMSDVSNMRKAAKLLLHNRKGHKQPRNVVVMDNLRCGHPMCFNPTKAWKHSVAKGEIIEMGCQVVYSSDGWCWGTFNTSV